MGFSSDAREASKTCSRRLRVNTDTGSSSEISPISQRRRTPLTTLATLFSHGLSILIRSTAAIFG